MAECGMVGYAIFAAGAILEVLGYGVGLVLGPQRLVGGEVCDPRKDVLGDNGPASGECVSSSDVAPGVVADVGPV